ncbi:MAG: hypothetical protein JO217_07080 [Acidobacteriaceae bacterium]|nr:hypothetical protein [Acidobacteriaceae bacterium]
MIDKFQRWVTEPPPDHLFELTELTLSGVSPRAPGQQRHEFLDERGLMASPAAPNVLKPQLYTEVLRRFAKSSGSKKAPAAAIVIPDYAVRMAILDFEQFPSSEEERLALLRFRLRKSVPFHVDEAQLSYSIQFEEAKRLEVLAVAIARPILSEYENIFTDAGFRVGVVAPSSLAALRLFGSAGEGLTLVAKSAGDTLSVLLIERGRVRLVRCLDFCANGESNGVTVEEGVLSSLRQTVAYAEDQLGKPVSQLMLCGFGDETDDVGSRARTLLGIPYAPVRSKFGAATQANAGMLGLLEFYSA